MSSITPHSTSLVHQPGSTPQSQQTPYSAPSASAPASERQPVIRQAGTDAAPASAGDDQQLPSQTREKRGFPRFSGNPKPGSSRRQPSGNRDRPALSSSLPNLTLTRTNSASHIGSTAYQFASAATGTSGRPRLSLRPIGHTENRSAPALGQPSRSASPAGSMAAPRPSTSQRPAPAVLNTAHQQVFRWESTQSLAADPNLRPAVAPGSSSAGSHASELSSFGTRSSSSGSFSIHTHDPDSGLPSSYGSRSSWRSPSDASSDRYLAAQSDSGRESSRSGGSAATSDPGNPHHLRDGAHFVPRGQGPDAPGPGSSSSSSGSSSRSSSINGAAAEPAGRPPARGAAAADGDWDDHYHDSTPPVTRINDTVGELQPGQWLNERGIIEETASGTLYIARPRHELPLIQDGFLSESAFRNGPKMMDNAVVVASSTPQAARDAAHAQYPGAQLALFEIDADGLRSASLATNLASNADFMMRRDFDAARANVLWQAFNSPERAPPHDYNLHEVHLQLADVTPDRMGRPRAI